jgi:DNA-binding NtrC family response regulator
MDAKVRIPADRTLRISLEHAERVAVEKVLAQTHGNVAEAAAMLGILRTSLYRIMKRCGIASSCRARK